MLHKVIGRVLQDLVALLILSLIASTLSLLAAPIAWAQAPPNDDFANATVISSLPFSETLDTSQATTEPVDAAALAACGNPVSAVAATVWYAYTPPEDQGVRFFRTRSSYSTGVGVFTGGPGNLSPAGFCSVGGGSFSAVAGETYHILVADIEGGNGGTLDIAASAFPFDFTVDGFGRVNAGTGEATVTGTVSCPAGGSGRIFVSLTQGLGTATVSGSGFADIFFEGTQQAWSATIQPPSGKFEGGEAAVVADAGACANEHVERTIVLSDRRQCDDGRDNDADGRIDFPADHGCVSASDDDERDSQRETVSCGQVIRQTTKVQNDLVNCPNNGLVIGADNITLDLNGHTIDGSAQPDQALGSIGITNAGHDGVTVEDGRVQGFRYGVTLGGATGNRIRRLTVADNRTNGLALFSASGNVIEKNRFLRNGFDELALDDSDRNLVRENSTSLASDLFDFTVGINVDSSSGNRIERNKVTSHRVGILVIAGGRLSGNTVVRNRSTDNTEDGIFVLSENARIVGNRANRNGDDGILAGELPAALTRNIANHNGDLGIEASPGIPDSGGNRARGNGNPLQCVNVFCR